MTKTPSSILEHLALINEVELEVKSEAAGRIHEPTFTVTVSVKGKQTFLENTIIFSYFFICRI
jgi:hypothetical protein